MEITEIPALTPGEESLVDMHSLINTLSVLRGELQVIGLVVADDARLFPRSLGICDRVLASFSDRRTALEEAARVDAYQAEVESEISEYFARHPQVARPDRLDEARENMQSVFTILRVRARETLARAAAPDRWQDFACDDVLASLRQFFAATERNGKGRFRILFNAARQGTSDYYADLNIESSAPSGLAMPSVVCDVMRDLLANARKYTAPGGTIIGALYREPQRLHLLVSDTGRGIPPAELQTVVHFGKRASNVCDVRTFGGGFGLTKAFLVAKQFHGRFWIDSELGAGTRVRIEIPCP